MSDALEFTRFKTDLTMPNIHSKKAASCCPGSIFEHRRSFSLVKVVVVVGKGAWC